MDGHRRTENQFPASHDGRRHPLQCESCPAWETNRVLRSRVGERYRRVGREKLGDAHAAESLILHSPATAGTGEELSMNMRRLSPSWSASPYCLANPC